MTDQVIANQEYDVFLSYATEDREWAQMLAERLRSSGVRVWFDVWELQPGDHVRKLNDGLKYSRKVVAVWTPNYFRDDKFWTLAESYAKQDKDLLARERPLVPVLRLDCDIEPLFRPLIYLDCRRDDDFELRFRQLIEAIDLPRREFQSRDEFEFREHELSRAELGRRSYKKGKRFEDEVAALYRVLGFEVKADTELSGVQIDLMIRQKLGGANVEFIVECKDKRITADERNQILAQQAIAQKKLPRHRWIAVSSQGFAADTRVALEESGVDCVTYAELLRELIPLDNYADGLVAEYEKEAERRWEGEDWFIRPDLMTDITYERLPALEHLSRWLGEERRNQLVILGDLGTGKTTLASFLAYNLARSFRDDPLRHRAPVLIPLKEVRKEFSLESIVINHFARRGLRDISFSRFEHLVRLGKVILLFDAFDEMADRIRWEDTQNNFRELSRAADWQGKVILTCRTHYFKDRTEQVKVIGEGPRLSETETDLYRELRQRSTAEVVFLQEFDDAKIQGYLRKARPKDHAADWKKIQEIYNLKDLATRPLLLDMVVKTLPKLKPGEEVNAAKLYNVYTNIWIDREEDKNRKFRLVKETKLALMMELAWRMWRDERPTVHYKELAPFVQTLLDDQKIEIGDEEIADVASEMQGASFLKRDDNGNFGFMHRSFGEFFVAKKIAAALSVSSPTVKEGLATEDPALADARATDTAVLHEALNTRRYDQKTIFFLSQLDEADAMREPLQEILRNKFQPNVSENALQLLYWSARIRCGMEEEISDITNLKAALARRIPANANLQGAKLQEVVLECADLTSADFSSADLTKSKLNHSILDRGNFQSAQLGEASVENSSILDSDFSQAILTKASFLESDLTGSDFREALDTNATNFSGKGDGLPRIWNTKNLQALVQYGPKFDAYAVSHSPDGSLLAAGGLDGNVYVYRSEDGVLLRVLEGHTNGVNSVLFSSDGETLASGSDDNLVKLWQVHSGNEIHTLRGHLDFVWSVSFSSDGEVLASGSADNSVMLWQVHSGKEIRSLRGHSGPVRSVSFSPDGQMLASGSTDNSVKLWHVHSGKEIRSLRGHSGPVRSVSFSPDGQTLASGSADKSVKLWQIHSGNEIRSLSGHLDYVNSVSFSPNGQALASGSADGSVKLWQVSSGQELRSPREHFGTVRSVSFSPNGKTLASGSADGSVKLWQVSSGKEIRSLSGHSRSVNSASFSPDGQILASGSDDGSVKLWQVHSGNEIRSLRGHSGPVRFVSFSPDGQTLASLSDDKSVKLWQAHSGNEIRSLRGHSGPVNSVLFSPDGQTLASGSDDNSVKLWQVHSGKLLATLTGNLGAVLSVGFSPDGKYLVSAGVAGRLQFWDLATYQTFLYRYHFGPGAWLDLLPDGRFDASPEGMRYLGYTGREELTYYPAESLVKEFYSPEAVAEVLAKYTA